jgi:hypothetical protein
MSAEHGHGHGSESVTVVSIIQAILCAITLIPAMTEPVEEVVAEYVQGSGGHGGGHH